jgi:hypothetical protein
MTKTAELLQPKKSIKTVQHSEPQAAEHPEASAEDLRKDGTLLSVFAETAPYVVQGGKASQVPSPQEFAARGFDPNKIMRVPADLRGRLTVGPPLAPSVGVLAFASGDQFLGAGHYMNTHGTLDRQSGRVAATTRIRTITWFGGYHGSAHIIFADTNDAPVWQSQDHRYGVDGTAVGTSDRTTAWFEAMKAGDTGRVTAYYLFQAWAPDDFMTILNKWVAAGKSVASLAASVASVAKVATGKF